MLYGLYGFYGYLWDHSFLWAKKRVLLMLVHLVSSSEGPGGGPRMRLSGTYEKTL
jgi:hypothetical protein